MSRWLNYINTHPAVWDNQAQRWITPSPQGPIDMQGNNLNNSTSGGNNMSKPSSVNTNFSSSQLNEIKQNSINPSQALELTKNSKALPSSSGIQFTNPFNFGGKGFSLGGLGSNVLSDLGEAGKMAVNGQSWENLGRDTAVGLLDAAEDIGKTLGSHENPNYPASQFLGSAGKPYNSISNAVSDIANTPIAYDVNAPQDPTNRFTQGLIKSIPLMANPLGEGAAAESAATAIARIGTGSGIDGALNSVINPNQSVGTSYAEGAIPFGIGAVLGKGAQLAGHYLFSRSGMPVEQLGQELSQISKNKDDALQSLDAVQSPINESYSDAIAESNIPSYATDYKQELNGFTGVGNNVGDALSSWNSTAKAIGEQKYNDANGAAQFDENEMPQSFLSNMATPQEYLDLKNWNMQKDLTSEELMESLPADIQQHIKAQFPSQNNSLKAGSLFDTSGAQGNLPVSDFIQSQLQAALRKEYGLSDDANIPDYQLPENITPEGLIESLPIAYKKRALLSLQENGSGGLNAWNLAANRLSPEAGAALKNSSAYTKLAANNFKNSNTIGNMKELIKNVNSALNPNDITLKNTAITDLSKTLQNQALLPAMKHFDSIYGTNSAEKQLQANAFHSNVVAPFNHTTDQMREAANNSLIDPQPESVAPILKKALEKITTLKKAYGEDGKKTNLYDTKIPNDHIVRKAYDKITNLARYRANDGLKAMSEGRFIGNKHDQIAAFESAIKSGDLPLDHSTVKKYYAPLKKQMDFEKTLKERKSDIHQMMRNNILQKAKNNREDVEGRLKVARDLQKKLTQNPGLMRSALINHAKILQYAAPIARIAKPIFYGNMNSPQ